jgi:signal transduction histidine kinase
MNDNLGEEIQERQRAENALHQAYALMETKVEERTVDLTTLNVRLQEEIAERQQAEQKALQVSIERERIRLLSDFIRDASHEFRTPLSIINTKVHLLKQAVGEYRISPTSFCGC